MSVKRWLCFVLLLCTLTCADAKSSLVKVTMPFGLSWHESKIKIIQSGVSLIPQSFVGVPNAAGSYLAPTIPNSTYSGALYSFSFDNTNKLAKFGILLSQVNSTQYNAIKKGFIKKYGKPYSKKGVDANKQAYTYLNWGAAAYGYLGLTYQAANQLVLISYFLPVDDSSSD